MEEMLVLASIYTLWWQRGAGLSSHHCRTPQTKNKNRAYEFHVSAALAEAEVEALLFLFTSPVGEFSILPNVTRCFPGFSLWEIYSWAAGGRAALDIAIQRPNSGPS